jgi:hypothetical protein
MADGTVGVAQSAAPDRLIDNELIGGSVYRQRTRIGGAALADLAGCDAANGLDVDVTRVAGTVTTSESWAGGTLGNGAETSVGGSATQLVAATAGRKKLIVQNNGTGAIRIGTTGVTATTGLRIKADGVAVFDMPHCPTNAIYAISESGTNTVLTQEVT